MDIRLLDRSERIETSGRNALTDPGYESFDFVPFRVTDRWADGEEIETPDLGALIQRLVAERSQGDGANDMAFSLAASKGTRRIEAQEFGDDVAAELTILYETPDVV